MIAKEDAACCVERALPDGRLPIGWCSPECIRRAEHLRRCRAASVRVVAEDPPSK